MKVPQPTTILRLTHVDNLAVCLRREGLHAPNFTPDDGLTYKTIHNTKIQSHRNACQLPCDPGGTIHDYVPFYFGPLSPMLLQLKTGRVEGYGEGQEPLIYIVSTVQAVQKSGTPFVFSDGHGIAAYTRWFNDLGNLNEVDWECVEARYWADSVNDMDRKRRKQAEFLVHKSCDWALVHEIAVIDESMKQRVENTLAEFPSHLCRSIRVEKRWYY
jgi:ssDNA thymidine ADP-ribosyltransferase DarT-like protein